MKIPSWEETYFRDVYNYATRSKDQRTKIGAVIVDWESKNSFSHGYNGFPRKVKDLATRWEKPLKYEYVVHAEENSILNCARHGYSTLGKILITQGLPCSSCGKSICNAGIKEVIVHKQWQEYEKSLNWKKWIESSKKTEEMFDEVGIKVRVFDGVLGIEGFLDGNIIKV